MLISSSKCVLLGFAWFTAQNAGLQCFPSCFSPVHFKPTFVWLTPLMNKGCEQQVGGCICACSQSCTLPWNMNHASFFSINTIKVTQMKSRGMLEKSLIVQRAFLCKIMNPKLHPKCVCVCVSVISLWGPNVWSLLYLWEPKSWSP